jgi:hypothetical protein
MTVAESPHRLDQLSILPHPYQAEVKCSLLLFGHQFCAGGLQSALCRLWFPPVQRMCRAHLGGLHIHLVKADQLQL